WILVGDSVRLYYLELRAGLPLRPLLLPPGVHVLENQALEPVSEKAAFVRSQVERALLPDRPLVPSLLAVLASHEVPPAVRAEPASARPLVTYAACVHAPLNGTRSAAIVQLPAAPESLPRIEFTDGAPCTQPLQSADALWRSG